MSGGQVCDTNKYINVSTAVAAKVIAHHSTKNNFISNHGLLRFFSKTFDGVSAV